MNRSEYLILGVLYEQYPKALRKSEIKDALPAMNHTDFERSLAYLVDKGLVTKVSLIESRVLERLMGIQTPIPAYRLTADSIDLIESIESRRTGETNAAEPLAETPSAPVADTIPEGVVKITEPTPISKQSQQMLEEMDKLNEQMRRFAEEIKKDERNFQRMFLGRIVEIFGIFIAIFTIVIITINITTKVPVDTPLYQLISYSLSMYLAPVVALLTLLSFVYLIVHR